MSNFIIADRKTDYLLPPSLDDWLAQDHLACFVVEVIDGLDLSRLTLQYAGRGSKVSQPLCCHKTVDFIVKYDDD